MVPIVLIDVEDSTEFTPGYWREDEETSQTFFNLDPLQFLGNTKANVKEVRNSFANYFVTKDRYIGNGKNVKDVRDYNLM